MLNSVRGIRNNNPGNVIKSDIKWQGMAAQQTDPKFVQFVSPEYGIRACAKLLMQYNKKDGCDTIRKMITRYAPQVDNNDTEAYVHNVAGAVFQNTKVGGNADTPVDVDDVNVMLPLLKAIFTQENGENPYLDATITQGMKMAGVVGAKVPLMRQTGFVAQAGTAVVAGAAAVSQYAAPIKGAADQLSGYTSAPLIAKIVTVLITVAGVLSLIGVLASIKRHEAT